jgi:putative molybdopterin biosynthesis protein
MTEGSHLYRQIAESFRQEIFSGSYKPGDRLPSVRETAENWGCTVGTAQRAYQELTNQGLVVSRSGQGTRVVQSVPFRDDTPLRRAMLVHRAENFLLEVLTGGYTLDEVEGAVRQAMDRWRMFETEEAPVMNKTLRFSGSHDLVITWLAGHFQEILPGFSLHLNFSGSLGGLIALVEGKSDMAGCHLWDEESDTYNLPFVWRLFPGQRMAIITVASRRLGLIVPSGNPLGIKSLEDLSRSGMRFVNRQPGSGTRVWLDFAVKKIGLDSAQIVGYEDERITHSAVAQTIAEGKANAGIGLEAAALSYGLDFVFLKDDRYDLVVPSTLMEAEPMKTLVEWLNQPATREMIEKLEGYNTQDTGTVQWSS